MTIPSRFKMVFLDDGVIEILAYAKGSRGPVARRFVQEGDDDHRLAMALVFIREQRGYGTTVEEEAPLAESEPEII